MYENLRQTLEECGREFVNRYRSNLSSNGHIATGNLANSVNYEIVDNGDVISIELNLADYWQYVEDGRRSGKFPPLDKILDWIRVKQILPTEINGKLPTEKQLAYLIGRKIAEEGTEGTHDLANAQETIKREFENKIQEAIKADYNAEVLMYMKDAGLLTNL